MKTGTLYLLVSHLLAGFIIPNLSARVKDRQINFEYTLTTKLFGSMNLSDPATEKYLKHLTDSEQCAIQEFLRYREPIPNLLKNNKTVKNLRSTPNHFANDNCLIAFNNIEGTDINPTTSFAVLLTQLDLAFGLAKYIKAMVM